MLYIYRVSAHQYGLKASNTSFSASSSASTKNHIRKSRREGSIKQSEYYKNHHALDIYITRTQDSAHLHEIIEASILPPPRPTIVFVKREQKEPQIKTDSTRVIMHWVSQWTNTKASAPLYEIEASSSTFTSTSSSAKICKSRTEDNIKYSGYTVLQESTGAGRLYTMTNILAASANRQEFESSLSTSSSILPLAY